MILEIKNVLDNSLLIINTLNLKVRIVKFKKIKRCICDSLTFIIFSLLIFPCQITFAEEFVMLKNNKVNVRYGPSFEYPIKYMYIKKICQ